MRIVGLKLFNVLGPNEAHKGDMRSLIAKAFPGVGDGRRMRLFQSDRPDFADGEQRRDFVYVKDVVECVLHFLDRPAANGLFNVGTGQARSWNDLARALFTALDRVPAIDYVPMPKSIRGAYQYFTQANVTKLHSTGFLHAFTPLETAVADYVRTYVVPDTRLAAGTVSLTAHSPH